MFVSDIGVRSYSFPAEVDPVASDRAPLEQSIGVIIPALDEEQSIGKVLADIPAGLVDIVVVVDNGSSDRTAAVAAAGGALVVSEARRGYGQACLTGMAALAETGVDIVVFLDADYSDYSEEMSLLVEPIIRGDADFVVGSRVRGERQAGALLPQARFGNALATWLIKKLYGVAYTDLGPFRAIRHEALKNLQMADRDFGWTVEMQTKAARHGLRVAEIPVRYRKRIGTSKVSGTVKGSILAGYKILFTIARYARS